MLAVSFLLCNFMGEFSYMITVYISISPRSVVDVACEKIHYVTVRLQIHPPDTCMVIYRDFNYALWILAAFHQVVESPTRNNGKTDLKYVNVRDAYIVTPFPSLGKSDHNLS